MVVRQKPRVSCSHCTKLVRLSYLNQHEKKIHNDHGDKTKCEICSKWVKNVERHRYLKHIDRSTKELRENAKVECETCNKKYSPLSIVNHKKTHEVEYTPPAKTKCETCNKFVLSKNYEKHLDTKTHKIREAKRDVSKEKVGF